MKTIEISKAAVYVGTYAKYNSGSLFGKWLNLADYSSYEDFYTACYELHSDENDPEFMFQDFENIPDELISESWISDMTFTVLQEIQRMDQDEIEPFLIWCDNGHHKLHAEDIASLKEQFNDEYIGYYPSFEDYAWEIVQERDDLSDFAKQYFDYEAYARDLLYGDYWCHDGHVFCIL